MSTNKIQTGLRLSEPLYEKLRVVSSREARSLNNLIEYALSLFLADYEAEHGTITFPRED